jgi:hypothetical protein
MNVRRILTALALVAAGCDSTTNTYYVLDLSVMGQPQPTPSPACTAGSGECIDVDIFRLCHDDGTWGADQQCPDGLLCDKGACVSPAPSTAPCFPGDTQCDPSTPGVILTCRATGDGYDVSDCPSGTACDPASFACAGACGPVGATQCNQNDISKVDTCNGNVITTAACPSGQLCVTNGDGVDACAPAACDPRSTCVVCGNPTLTTLDPGTILSFCGATELGYKWQPLTCPAPDGVCDPKGGGACAEGGAGAINATCAVAVGAVCTPGQTRCSADQLSIQTCNDKGQWANTSTCSAAKNEICQFTPDGSTVQCGDEACAFASGICLTAGPVTKHVACDATGHLAALSSAAACNPGHCVPTFGLGGLDDNGQVPGDCVVDCQATESKCAATGVTAIQSCVSGVWSAATTPCQTDGGVGVVECLDSTDPDSGLHHAFCGVCTPGTHRCTNATGGVDAGATFPFIETCGADGAWHSPVACTIGLCKGAEGAASCRVDCVPGKTVCVGAPFNLDLPAPQLFGTPAALTCNPNGTLPAAPNCAGNPNLIGCCKPVGGQLTTCRTDVAGNVLGCVQCVGSTENEGGLIDTRCTDVSGAQQSSINDSGGCGDVDHVALEVCKSDNTWGPPTQCQATLTCLDAFNIPNGNACAPCANGESGTDPCTDDGLQSLGFSGCTDPLLNAGAGYGVPSSCDTTPNCCHQACQLLPGAPAACIAGSDC